MKHSFKKKKKVKTGRNSPPKHDSFKILTITHVKTFIFLICATQSRR